MIKIRFPDENAFRTAYLAAVKPLVRHELNRLIIALDQARGNHIVNTPNFRTFKDVTRKVINTLRVEPIAEGLFNRAVYIATVTNYRHQAALHPVNLDGLYDLMALLADEHIPALDNLLLCPPEGLSAMHQQLLGDHGLDQHNEREISIIKLVFDYGAQTAIGEVIRDQFRNANLVHYCPYCNQGRVMFTAGLNGQVANVHQLDHFFDKASYPLLAYSLYNLIPGDAICNVTNKGTAAFNNTYHMNPYLRGFGADAVFSATIDDVDFSVTGIMLDICTHDPALLRQLVGNGGADDVLEKRGNINAFQLNAKYDRPDVREQAGYIVAKVRNVANNFQNIQGILEAAALPHLYERYARWYRENLHTRFEERDFHLFAYSKLFRDLHDEVYRKNGGAPSPELQAILDQRFLQQ